MKISAIISVTTSVVVVVLFKHNHRSVLTRLHITALFVQRRTNWKDDEISRVIDDGRTFTSYRRSKWRWNPGPSWKWRRIRCIRRRHGNVENANTGRFAHTDDGTVGKEEVNNINPEKEFADVFAKTQKSRVFAYFKTQSILF